MQQEGYYNVFTEWWWCGGYCQQGRASKRQTFATLVRGVEVALGSEVTLSSLVKPQRAWRLMRKASFWTGRREMWCSVKNLRTDDILFIIPEMFHRAWREDLRGSVDLWGREPSARWGLAKERCETWRISLLPQSVPRCLLVSDERREGPGLSGGVSCFWGEPLVLGTLGIDQADPRIFTALVSSS